MIAAVSSSRGGIHRQFIVFGIAPAAAGDVPVIRRPRLVGVADIAFCLPQRVPVYLHDTTDSVVERRVNEHTDNIFMLPQNIIRGAPYDNAQTVVGDAADDPVLRRDGALDHLRAEIEIVHRVRSVLWISEMNSRSSPLSCAASATISL